MPAVTVRNLLTPDQWKSRTSKTFSRRSISLILLDSVYRRFATSDTSDIDAAESMLFWLHTYLVEKGGMWSRVSRNVESGGYMATLYEDLLEGLKGRPAVERLRRGDDFAARDKIRKEMIPHSRLGVLYLLGSIKVEVDRKGAALAGVMQAITVGAGAGTLDYSGPAVSNSGVSPHGVLGHGAHSLRLDPTGTTATIPGFNLGHLDIPHVGAIPLAVDSYNVTADSVVSAGAGLTKVAKNILGGTSTKGQVGWVREGAAPTRGPGLLPPSLVPYRNKPLPALPGAPPAPSPRPAPPLPPRPGAVLPTATRPRSSGMPPPPLPPRPGRPADPDASPQALAAGIEKAMGDTARAIHVKLKLRPDEIAGYAGLASKLAIKEAAQYLLGAALPFAGAGMAIGTGLLRTIDAGQMKVNAWLERRQIVLLTGHPASIATAIETQMEWAIGQGLFDTLKGAVDLSAQILLPGLGSLAAAIVSALEWLVKTIMRAVEVGRIDKWLAKAHEKYGEIKAEHQAVHGEDGGIRIELNPRRTTSIVYNTQEFADWFQEGCDASPIIPMLTLTSGVCTSLMTMVEMVKDDGNVIDDKMAQTAIDYTTRIKVFASKYLRNAGFRFLPVNKDDQFLPRLLGHAVNDNQTVSTKLSRAKAGALA